MITKINKKNKLTGHMWFFEGLMQNTKWWERKKREKEKKSIEA
jgi:hypothetical protein